MSLDVPQSPEDERRSMLVDISGVMIKLFKEQFGRGPTTARSYWCGPDAVACFLEDTLTPAERNLVKMGEHQRLRDTRIFFQYASVREFCEPVERITGRTVRSFQSSLDTEVEGLCVETFIFYPKGREGPPRGSLAEG